MEIVSFEEKHLEGAAAIAFAHWGGEHRHADADTRQLIYRYLVRYYFHPASPFSLAAVEDGEVCGMLLAHRKSDAPFPAAAWLAPHLTPLNRAILTEYTAYLDGNREKEEAALAPDETVLALFASKVRGCGRLLMSEFERRCREKSVPSMLLWTDDTCDFSYYYHNGFTEVAKMPTDPVFDGPRELTTFLFRKALPVTFPFPVKGKVTKRKAGY